MPQMMPINWMLSFILFICIFILFNMMNYYIFLNKNNNMLNINNNKTLKKNFNWKW